MTTNARDAIRAKVLSTAAQRAKTKIVEFFGSKIELHQPSVGQLMDMGSDPSKLTFVSILLNYAFVPGTDEKLFEAGDIEELNKLPFNEEVNAVINAMTEFTDLSVKAAEKN